MTQALVPQQYDDAQISLIQKTVSDPRNPLTRDELTLFISVCQMTGLNPLLNEVYAIKERGGGLGIWTGIAGIRRAAGQSGLYAGQEGPFWCGEDGQWTDVWLKANPPAACKVGVWGTGDKNPTWATVHHKEFQRNSPKWREMPAQMLAIRAEFNALKKRFPRDVQQLRLTDNPSADADEESQTTAHVYHPSQPALNGGDHADAEYTERDQDDQSGAVPASAGSQEAVPPPTPVGLTPPPAQSARDVAVSLYQACLAIGMKVTRPYIRSEDTPEAKDAAYRAWTKEWRVKYEVEQAKQTNSEDDNPFPPEQVPS